MSQRKTMNVVFAIRGGSQLKKKDPEFAL